ncbi:MAG: tRNA pseudouridine(38-40) synthase TruA [Clostridia bacterium]|nr:tRNA pseudouridine(38-40) synthase TruA [Clostridia bacterium]
MNIRLDLQYDGTNYHGWQTQPNAITVQSVITRAIATLTAERINLIGCGRTDAKVHAINYTANFETNTTIPISQLPYAINSHLPNDIVIKRATLVDDNFRANQSAKKKTYVYRVLNSEFPDAFLTNYTWHYKYDLDIGKMKTAAREFLGEHDFVGFASAGFSVKTTVRTIYSLDISKNDDIIEFEICGNGFLYNMVRIITGTLVNMGNGRLDYTKAGEIIASCDRERAGITAPPQGLFLKEVFY